MFYDYAVFMYLHILYTTICNMHLYLIYHSIYTLYLLFYMAGLMIDWNWFIGTAEMTDIDPEVYQVIESIYDILLEFINNNPEAWAPIITKVNKKILVWTKKCLPLVVYTVVYTCTELYKTD